MRISTLNDMTSPMNPVGDDISQAKCGGDEAEGLATYLLVNHLFPGPLVF
jgi:hypothetical protein